MMKKLILASMLALFGTAAYSQWSNTGNNYTTAQLGIGSSATWAPITIHSIANASGNLGVSLAFEGTNHSEIGYRFKANGANYYQVLYNGSTINWKHYEGGNYVSKMSLSNTGSLGIGVSNPNSKIDVLSESTSGQEHLLRLQVADAQNDYLRIMNATNATGQFIPSIYGYHNSDNRQALYITGAVDPANDVGSQPIMVFDSRLSGASVSIRPLFAWDSYENRKMTLNSNGSLGIGTSTTGSHKLAVEGSIGAREVKVEASGWSDFVFQEGYKLKPLNEVEEFISTNKHLPDVPNESEVLENGINLGDMNAILLQKVEELTLYLIEQNKKIERLEKEIVSTKKDRNLRAMSKE